jgi:hypothetical protein
MNTSHVFCWHQNFLLCQSPFFKYHPQDSRIALLSINIPVSSRAVHRKAFYRTTDQRYIDVWPGTPVSLAWLVSGCNTLGGGSFSGHPVPRLAQPRATKPVIESKQQPRHCPLQIFSYFWGDAGGEEYSICLFLTGIFL